MTLDRVTGDRTVRPAGRRKIPAGPTVLVVEDNDLIAVLIRDTLQSYGYRVFLASDAREGILLARALRPHVILMDICLPQMSGLEATRIIKAEPPLKDIPVVAVTAHAMSGDQERILDGGCEAYLSKPFRMADLLRVVEEAVKHPRGRVGTSGKVRRLPRAS